MGWNVVCLRRSYTSSPFSPLPALLQLDLLVAGVADPLRHRGAVTVQGERPGVRAVGAAERFPTGPAVVAV